MAVWSVKLGEAGGIEEMCMRSFKSYTQEGLSEMQNTSVFANAGRYGIVIYP